jgi:hypothetical protein
LWKRLLNLPVSAVRFSVVPWWSVVAFLNAAAGREYSIGLIVTRLLQTPASVEGAVAEFGCYKGFSTSSLSLACAFTNRRLIVFDSFEGLPAPEADVVNLDSGRKLPCEKGQFTGALGEVKGNVSRFGDLSVCEFVKGYYDDTLPRRDPSEKFVLIFEDADLPESVRTVLPWTWRKLQDGCTFFCHEARDREVVGIFFDDN